MFRLSYRKIFLGMNVMPWWRSTTKESVKTFWGILTDTSIKQKLFFWKYQNFDIIHKQCRGEVVSNELLKYHQTVNQTQVSEYPSMIKKTFYQVLFVLIERILFSKNLLKNIFKKISPKNQTVIFRKSSF